MHRYEVIFLFFIGLLLCGAGIGYYLLTADATITLSSYRFELVALNGIMFVTCVMGLFLIYPVIRRNLRENGRLSETAKDLTKKSETYQHAALTDPLTGLQNRRYFDDALEEYLQEFSKIDRPLGLLILDLDHFKSINDTYGHDVGDEVLKSVTACLLDYTRHHDVVARIGGEEFAVLAPNLTEDAIVKLANRIRVAISELRFDANKAKFSVTSSMGMALWDGREEAANLIKRADQKLYHAKNSGRNRVAA